MKATAIKRARKRMGLKVAEFAKVVEVDPSTVYKWERGDMTPDPPVAKLIRILEAQHVNGQKQGEGAA